MEGRRKNQLWWRKKLNGDVGTVKLWTPKWGALEKALPFRVVSCWAKMADFDVSASLSYQAWTAWEGRDLGFQQTLQD